MKNLLILLFSFASLLSYSQKEHFLYNQVQEIKKRHENIDLSKNLIVFTGSSSVRMWHDVQQRFPNKNIINTGFGHSQMYDLDLFVEDLVIQYNPKLVFIYEGDNDIVSKKSILDIMETLDKIIKKIKTKNKDTKIVLISVKPSIKRWHLKRKYRKLNRKFKRYSKQDGNIYYADIWNIMLERRNKINSSLFLSDGLHMNSIGYDLWTQVLTNYINL